MRVGVVVPARDEAALLPRCLEALERAVAQAGAPCQVVLVLDACTDDSTEVVDALQQRLDLPLTVLQSSAGSVGAARATGATWLLDRQGGEKLWLASTDADSAVCQDWLSGQLELARQGAVLVAGTVVVDSWSGWSAGLRRRYAHSYARQLDHDGHGHVHGANLGLTADLYRELGGFAQQHAGEDVALVAAAQAAGVTVTWTSDLPVTTSARHRGRAPHGFATHLRHLEAALLDRT